MFKKIYSRQSLQSLKSWQHAKNFYVKSCKDTTYVKSPIWSSFSEDDKAQAALTSSEVDSAELAYYQGLAFMEFDKEFTADAMWAFNKAIELDTAGVFTDKAKEKLAVLLAGIPKANR